MPLPLPPRSTPSPRPAPAVVRRAQRLSLALAATAAVVIAVLDLAGDRLALRIATAVPPPAGAAAAPAQDATPTPDPRPNLVAKKGYWKLKGRNLGQWGRCVYGQGYQQGFHLCVANTGRASSGPFTVTADGAAEAPLLSTGGLEPAETLCAPVAVAPGVALVVDAADAVDEVREDDNRLPPVPVPTLEPVAYPTCVPRPTPLAELWGNGWNGFVDTQGYPCWPTHLPTIIRSGVRVFNDGEVAAGPFRIGPPGWSVPDLPADADRTLDDARAAGGFSTQIDPENLVPEHDETNNRIDILRATAPVPCTPVPGTPTTPTPSATPSPATPVTPSPSPAPVTVTPGGPTPTPGAADLTANVRLRIDRCQLDDGALVGAYGYRPCIVNLGGTAVRDVVVRIGLGREAQDLTIAQLDGGGQLCLAERPLVPTVIEVDPDGRIAEADETNNRVPVHIPPERPPVPCTPGPGPTATPTPVPLPNLRGWVHWWLDLPDGCIPIDRPLPPFYSELTIDNDGGAPAGPFDVVSAVPAGRRWAFDGLPAGATYTRGPEVLTYSVARIDPDDRVAERDETDNEIYVPVPTLPPYCPTATPTPDGASSTPTAGTVTPTPTPGTVTPAPTSLPSPSATPTRGVTGRLYLPLGLRAGRLAGP